MFVRRRPLLRAAVVGGGAYMAGKSVANRQAEQSYAEDEQNARIGALEQQQTTGYGQPPAPGYGQPPPPPPPPAPAGTGGNAGAASIADQLNQLADLHARGVLTDEEFAAAKAGVLGT